jgi:hypothetical protein
MNLVKYVRSFGFGGLLCGGLAGLLFIFFPDSFPQHLTLEVVMLIAATLGASAQRFTYALIFKPLRYYTSLAQLVMLRRHIGEKTYSEIIRQLTLTYFLGESNPPRPLSPKDEKRDTPTAGELI